MSLPMQTLSIEYTFKVYSKVFRFTSIGLNLLLFTIEDTSYVKIKTDWCDLKIIF